MRRGALVILALAVVACGSPKGRLFHTTLTTSDGSYPLPVTLGDRTHLVIGIDPGARDSSVTAGPAVRSDSGDPNVLIVSWLGGMCDDESVVSFWPDDDGYWLTVATRGGLLNGGCPAAGVYRAIRITTSEPVAVDQIDVAVGL